MGMPVAPAVDYNAPTKMWYDEISFYNYDAPGFGSDTGHFTQVTFFNTGY